MVLKGSLGTFDIISVIQMLTSQQATGILHVKGLKKDQYFDVYLDNGMFVKAIPMQKPFIIYLAERLQKAAILDVRQVKVLSREAKRAGLSEADILKRFPVTVSDIFNLIRSVSSESLHIMHHLKKGSYEFEPTKIEYDPSIVEPINAEFILMESARIVDEVAQIKWNYTDDMVFKRTHPESKEHEIKTQDNAVLSIIDGKKTAIEIYYMSLLSKNEVLLILTNLLQKGMVSIYLKGKEFKAAKPSIFSKFVLAAKAVLTFIINVIIIVMILYYSKVNPFRSNGYTVNITYSNILQYIGNYQKLRIENAIDMYKIEFGRYPDSLEVLLTTHILKADDLTFPYGSEYYYSKGHDNYILLEPKYTAR